MDIRQFDVSDDTAFSRYYEIMRAAELAEDTARPFWTEHEAKVFFGGDDSEEPVLLAAFEGDTMVGGGLAVFTLMDNTDKCFVSAFVAPELRRRGIGSALVEEAKALAVQRGRSTVLAESTISFDRRDDHPDRRFAEKHGFALASVEVARMLQLPVDDAKIQGWIDAASPHHEDYRLATFGDEVPEGLIPTLCDVLNQIALDAPTGDIDFEEERTTPEIWRQRRAKLLEQGRHPLMTLGLDSTGEVVALTQIVVPPEDRPKAYQWGTVVHRQHRGHRLGMAVKARNLRALQERFPDRTTLWTTNEEHNGPMLDINITMGFEPINTLQCYQWKAPA
jgi:GNAT superfamily N-acetyltransferase